jgi:aerobic-type carbon monoxide dehydrogenase small subunit (CoxS/CutS family)
MTDAVYVSHRVRMRVNGRDREVDVEPRRLLTDVLREDLGLTGTHVGCEQGVCGACTVLIDGQAARSCLCFAVQCEGADIVTVEGLATGEALHPLQEAFSRHHALQCGFCTPGMLMLALDLIDHAAYAGPERVREVMASNLCRCTGYEGIVAAVLEVAEARRTA